MNQSKNYNKGFYHARSLTIDQKNFLQIHLPGILYDHDKFLNIYQQKKTILEIGFGKGEHLISRALNDIDSIFIGCELFLNGIFSILSEIYKNKIHNIMIFQNDARILLDQFPINFLDEIILLFPDPWPKKRHHKRRFIQIEYIKQIHKFLKNKGVLKIATDHKDYQSSILETFSQSEILQLFKQVRQDIHQRPDLKEWPQTRYEQKAIKNNSKIIYLEFQKML
jgi:tRNA (guanine-N7-)-methyltransferase